MAGEEKNKASISWISKIRNYIKNIRKEEREFWGPVALSLGIIAFSNGITSLTNYLNSPPPSDRCVYLTTIVVNIIFGLAFFILGLIIQKRDNKFLIRTFATCGFSLFFVGVNISTSHQLIGLLIIVISVILIALGFQLTSRLKKQK